MYPRQAGDHPLCLRRRCALPATSSPILPLPDLASPSLMPISFALNSAYSKIVEPALKCAFKLFSLYLVHAEIIGSTSYGDQASTNGSSGSILRLLQVVS
ncbi:hypothetical protein NL676_033189 [Syzygium grande]|nr:hypothetical protein NL676_033189 [Syzygium grande]